MLAIVLAILSGVIAIGAIYYRVKYSVFPSLRRWQKEERREDEQRQTDQMWAEREADEVLQEKIANMPPAPPVPENTTLKQG